MQVVSLDFSEVVIDKMRGRHGDACGEWVVGDVTRLPEQFPKGSFSVVVRQRRKHLVRRRSAVGLLFWVSPMCVTVRQHSL